MGAGAGRKKACLRKLPARPNTPITITAKIQERMRFWRARACTRSWRAVFFILLILFYREFIPWQPVPLDTHDVHRYRRGLRQRPIHWLGSSRDRNLPRPETY